MNTGNILHRTKYGFIAGFGFMLSPLSWWNDLVVNIPLAYAFAYVVGMVISYVTEVNILLFMLLFLIGYWLTNVLGMALLRVGVANVIRYEEDYLSKTKKKLLVSFKWDVIIACGYSVLIALLVYYDFGHILSYIKAYPEWVVK